MSRLRPVSAWPLSSSARLDSFLLDACSQSREADALALLSKGARPRRLGPKGSTPLMFAARHDLPALFSALCSHPDGAPRARDERGRDALFWASARAPFCRLSSRAPSDLFSRIDANLFALDNLDADGRHACQMAFQSGDEKACVFWFARAPEGLIDSLIELLDPWQRAIGLHERASRLRALSQRSLLSASAFCPSPATARPHPAIRL